MLRRGQRDDAQDTPKASRMSCRCTGRSRATGRGEKWCLRCSDQTRGGVVRASMKCEVSVGEFDSTMPSPRFEAQARRREEQLNRQLAGEIVRLGQDAGLSQREVAAAAGVDRGYFSRIENALVEPSTETYARIAAVLGADLSAHLYPSSGPSIHDRHQAPILEGLIASLHRRWQPFPEVAVRHPARGWIDLAVHDPDGRPACDAAEPGFARSPTGPTPRASPRPLARARTRARPSRGSPGEHRARRRGAAPTRSGPRPPGRRGRA